MATGSRRWVGNARAVTEVSPPFGTLARIGSALERGAPRSRVPASVVTVVGSHPTPRAGTIVTPTSHGTIALVTEARPGGLTRRTRGGVLGVVAWSTGARVVLDALGDLIVVASKPVSGTAISGAIHATSEAEVAT